MRFLPESHQISPDFRTEPQPFSGLVSTFSQGMVKVCQQETPVVLGFLILTYVVLPWYLFVFSRDS